ncbi:MAG: hypothetical protein N3B12_08695, partial [Armatimonadetes bacterium]|nr:hypothetical protein [Armatimonadota bacterium]
MFAQKPPKLIRFGLRRDLLPLIYGVIRRFGLPALSHDCGLGMAPKALCALAAVVLMLTVTSAWCASDAPRNTGVESVRYKESREAEPASGEKDFLASLESAGNAEEQEREAPLYITLL